jgi:hypothetical protein
MGANARIALRDCLFGGHDPGPMFGHDLRGGLDHASAPLLDRQHNRHQLHKMQRNCHAEI